MRLLADENVHGKGIRSLREQGYALGWVKEIARRAEDRELLARPEMSDTIFVTNDSDFGDLIFRGRLPAPLAILYTRTEHRDWQLTTALLVAQLEAGPALNHITTITKDGVRRRAFPAGARNA